MARRDDLLEQIRALPFEDREHIVAELMRDAYESGRRTESPELLAEIERRAIAAVTGEDPGYSLEEAVAAAAKPVRKG